MVLVSGNVFDDETAIGAAELNKRLQKEGTGYFREELSATTSTNSVCLKICDAHGMQRERKPSHLKQEDE